jgi:alkylation response protein AidB-like acyl-CoA dehydrogenase
MAELGFMGMMVDPKYGGSGLIVFLCFTITEISKIDASTAVIMSVNNSLVCAGLEKYCNEEQKMKYLVPLRREK